MDKFRLQADEYEFPYHYIPEFGSRGFSKTRALRWGGEYLAYIKFVSEQIIGAGEKSVLDVGCGDGRLCQVLASTGKFDKIKGIDLADRAIAWAKMFNPGLEFECEDVAAETETYEAVTAIEVIEHIPDDGLDSFFEGLSKVLKDDGRIYITVPSICVPVSEKHYRHYTEELLSKQVSDANCGLIVEKSCYIVPNVGKWHHFFLQMLTNRFWSIDFLNKLVWKSYWRNGLIADRKTGSHVFAVIKKG